MGEHNLTIMDPPTDWSRVYIGESAQQESSGLPKWFICSPNHEGDNRIGYLHCDLTWRNQTATYFNGLKRFTGYFNTLHEAEQALAQSKEASEVTCYIVEGNKPQ